MKPLVTVGISFHNEERNLREAVESILRQTEKNLEVLLVDDGSTDDSLSVACSFSGDPRVRVLADGRRRRLPARLNQIVAEAQGAFVARMDADDISHPDRLARQLRLYAARPSLDAVGTWAALIGSQRQILAVSESTAVRTPRAALEHGLLVHASVIGRTEWFRAHPYDDSLDRAEDRDLWCRTVNRSQLQAVCQPLYLVRVLPRSSDFLSNYRESQRQNGVLLRRYGREVLGPSRTAVAYLATLAKPHVMAVAIRVGLADQLVRRRGRAPTALESEIVREALSP